MKVLFLTRRFYPDIGGVEKHVLEIAKRLINQGHQVTVIAESSAEEYSNNLKRYQSIVQSDTHHIKTKQPVKSSQTNHFELGKIKIIRIYCGEDSWFKKFRIWFELLKYFNQINKTDIVHCHDVFFWYLPFRFLLPQKKIFTTFHGYESYPVKKKAIVIRKVSELLSNGNICVGEFMKKWYRANPDYIIYGGVNTPTKFKKVSKPKAVFFGRLDKQTGIEMYLRAAEIIKKKIPTFELVVFGDGPLIEKVKTAVYGFDVGIEKKIANYRFVFVSRYLSILEALAAKKMVFAVYDNPVKRDYLEMSPFKDFVSISGNPKELASKVQHYYSNKKSEQEQINKAYLWVKSQTWNSVVDIYLKLWQKT